MIEILKQVARALLRNPGTKLMALMLAMVAWLWVQGQENHMVRIRVPLRFLASPTLVNVDPLPAAVSVTVEGTRAATRRARNTEMLIEVDLSKEKAGPGELLIDTYAVRGLPTGLAVLEYSPDRVRIRLDERSNRNVSVKPSYLGEVAGEGSIVSVTVVPDVAQVTGPRAVLDTLSVVPIKPIDVSGISESTQLDVELDLPRGVQTDWAGLATIVVEPRVQTLTISDVPVAVLRHSDAYVPDSSSVTLLLHGPTKVLRKLRTERLVLTIELPEDPTEERYVAAFQAPNTPRMDITLPVAEGVEVHTPPKPIVVVRR